MCKHMAARNSCSDVVSTKQEKEGSKPTPLALGISTLKPKYPQYALASRRTASFTAASTPWPADAHVKVEDLVDAGLVYTGVQDSVRCYHCGGGLRNWEPGDDPMVEHAKWYPACHHVLITKGKMFFRKVEDGDNPEDDTPSMTEDVRSDSLNSAVQAVIENGYPKEDAMRAISVIRIKNGPHAKITAADIASILLEAEDDPNFFLSFGVDNSEHGCSTEEDEGVQDSVRCYHCGGGLRNWEPGDDPMVEHAKWYPACHHVLITKGKMFFRKVEDGDNPEDDTPSMTEDVRSDSLNSAVQAVIENGYPKEDAMRAISVIRIKNGPHAKITAADIASILLEAEDDPNFFLSFGVDNSEHGCSTEEDEGINERETMEEENQKLKRLIICQICLHNEHDTVFRPCGHLVVCKDCASVLNTCNSCGKSIEDKIQIKRS
ncbi:baculoviral IAP repeat-containing protein 7-like isoform X2 [Mya arenaria]|uniref:baculoviral IAP repeat-containing protein 7-like isoform X2 n=1 Tax=Mya arenaria TaxID=6604 RepID=UPI0022DF8EDB|nr:baculoviral IAP repeat-containing protein 7-like isoform X2 [Mya arenaria]